MSAVSDKIKESDNNNKSGQYEISPITKKELTSTSRYCDTDVSLLWVR